MAPETKKEGELGESDAADHQITINYDTESLLSQLIYTLSLRWIPNNPNNPVVDFQMSSSEYLL